MAERKPEPRHEPDVQGVRPLVLTLLLAMLIIVVASVALWWGYELIREPGLSAQQGPEAEGQVHLQRHPRQDLTHLQARMQQRLDSVGWVDRDAGVVHMPIDRAMDLLVQRGLAVTEGAEPSRNQEGHSP